MAVGGRNTGRFPISFSMDTCFHSLEFLIRTWAPYIQNLQYCIKWNAHPQSVHHPYPLPSASQLCLRAQIDRKILALSEDSR